MTLVGHSDMLIVDFMTKYNGLAVETRFNFLLFAIAIYIPLKKIDLAIKLGLFYTKVSKLIPISIGSKSLIFCS